MKKITHQIGRHGSGFWFPRILVKEVRAKFVFCEESKYVDIDPDEWNILSGITFNPFDPFKNAIMIGWRYRQAMNVFEVGSYQIKEGKRMYPQRPVKFTSGQVGHFWLDYNSTYISNDSAVLSAFIGASNSAHTVNSKSIKKSYLKSMRMNPRFGIYSTPTEKIQFNLKYFSTYR